MMDQASCRREGGHYTSCQLDSLSDIVISCSQTIILDNCSVIPALMPQTLQANMKERVNCYGQKIRRNGCACECQQDD